MRTFKTEHIIKVAIGQPLPQSNAKIDINIKMIILFLCGIDTKEIYEISENHLEEIIKKNEPIYIQCIFEQYPQLKNITEEAKKMKWGQLIRKKEKILGKELSLARAESTTHVSAPEMKDIYDSISERIKVGTTANQVTRLAVFYYLSIIYILLYTKMRIYSHYEPYYRPW